MAAGTVARLIAVGRLLVGAVALTRPEQAAGPWMGPDARRPSSRALSRALGIRDMLLGAATLASVQRGDDPRPWLAAGVVADGVDFGATVIEPEIPLSNKAFITALAGGAVAIQLATLILQRGEPAEAP